MRYTDHTLSEAIEAVRLKMISDAYPARQAAIDAAIAEVDLSVAEYFFSRAEATRERVYGFLAPRMPELPASEEPAPVALQSDPAPQFNGHYADPYQTVEDDLPMYLRERA
jgi:hypothetical protein